MCVILVLAVLLMTILVQNFSAWLRCRIRPLVRLTSSPPKRIITHTKEAIFTCLKTIFPFSGDGCVSNTPVISPQSLGFAKPRVKHNGAQYSDYDHVSEEKSFTDVQILKPLGRYKVAQNLQTLFDHAAGKSSFFCEPATGSVGDALQEIVDLLFLVIRSEHYQDDLSMLVEVRSLLSSSDMQPSIQMPIMDVLEKNARVSAVDFSEKSSTMYDANALNDVYEFRLLQTILILLYKLFSNDDGQGRQLDQLRNIQLVLSRYIDVFSSLDLEKIDAVLWVHEPAVPSIVIDEVLRHAAFIQDQQVCRDYLRTPVPVFIYQPEQVIERLLAPSCREFNE